MELVGWRAMGDAEDLTATCRVSTYRAREVCNIFWSCLRTVVLQNSPNSKNQKLRRGGHHSISRHFRKLSTNPTHKNKTFLRSRDDPN